MPTLTDDPILEVKEGLAAVWAPGGKPIEPLKAVRMEEPKQAPDMPFLSMMFRSFRRARLEDGVVQGPIRDPLGGRRWVWRFYVRLWIAVASDEVAAQRTLEQCVPILVRALEEDTSLGGVADNAVLVGGDAGLVRPKQGNPTLMLSCDCSVETEEPLS